MNRKNKRILKNYKTKFYLLLRKFDQPKNECFHGMRTLLEI